MQKVYSTSGSYSAFFGTELARQTGASPDYEVIVKYGSGTLNIGTRVISSPEVSRSLERLFQETQISSIGLNVDNADGYFNPLGTGLFSVSSVYNKPIEIWKGFKYGWTGSTWGTAEYVPAFTGYIDNVQIDSRGRAVINARDKGKLFQNNTSEKCTQTGTAGGAYWVNERIDENVEHLLQQSVSYGSANVDYFIDTTYLLSYNALEKISTINNDTTANSMAVINQNVYMINNNGIYSFDGLGTASFIGTYNGGNVTDGTYLYGSNLYRYNPVNNTGTLLPGTGTTNYTNMIYMQSNSNLYFTNGTSLHYISINGGTIGTIIHTYHTSSFTIDGIYSREFPITNGTNIIVKESKSQFGNYEGTCNISVYNFTGGTIVASSTVAIVLGALPVVAGGTTRLSNKVGYNNGTFFLETNTYPGGAFFGGYDTGTSVLVTIRSSDLFPVINSNNGFYSGGTFGGREKYYSTIDNTLYYTSGGSLYNRTGTVNTFLDITGLGNLIVRSFTQIGTTTNYPKRLFMFTDATGTTLQQYSSMYYVTIGTFDVGNGDKVSDVLQTLAEAANYVQYIDEQGIYYFKRRDSGTTIDYAFGTNDIIDITVQEGEGISQSPIFNKAIWGTNTGTVSYEDLASQGTYGLQAYTLNNKWVTSSVVANDILYGIVNDYNQPKSVITTKLRYYPVVKLFDVVGLDYSRMGLSGTKAWQVIGLSEGMANTTLTLKEV